MRHHHAFLLLALFGAGCAGTLTSQALTNDHPASADAASSPMPEMSNVLRQSEPIVPAAGSGGPDAGQSQHGGMNHGMNGMGAMQGGASSAPDGAASQPAQPPAAAAYACPMHPKVTSDKPAKCPKCGMKLVKSDKDQASGGAHEGH